MSVNMVVYGYDEVARRAFGRHAETPEHWAGFVRHAAIDSRGKIWLSLVPLSGADFRLDNPDIMWFDDAKTADAWVRTCWRMR